jgi:hypothetical protein
LASYFQYPARYFQHPAVFFSSIPHTRHISAPFPPNRPILVLVPKKRSIPNPSFLPYFPSRRRLRSHLLPRAARARSPSARAHRLSPSDPTSPQPAAFLPASRTHRSTKRSRWRLHSWAWVLTNQERGGMPRLEGRPVISIPRCRRRWHCSIAATYLSLRSCHIISC